MDTKKTKSYVSYCLKQAKELRRHGIIPILIFDGGSLPSKAHTNNARRAERIKVKAKVAALVANGKKKEAFEVSKTAVEVTSLMVNEVIQELRRHEIEFMVSPYESDAQLTYLQRTGFIDAILTEDSDLLAYGCESVLFKTNLAQNGSCTLINSSDIKKMKQFKNWLVSYTSNA
jgi:exonuclease-1